VKLFFNVSVYNGVLKISIFSCQLNLSEFSLTGGVYYKAFLFGIKVRFCCIPTIVIFLACALAPSVSPINLSMVKVGFGFGAVISMEIIWSLYFLVIRNQQISNSSAC